MGRQMDYSSWLRMMAEYAPFRLQLGEFNMCGMCGHNKPLLVSMHDRTLYKAYRKNFLWTYSNSKQHDQGFQTHSSSAEDNRTEYVRMVHELILSWKFGWHPVLFICFTYTSCWKYAFVLVFHINGYSKALPFLFLNNMCLGFMWNVRCWKLIFVLSDIIQCLNPFVCMILSSLNTKLPFQSMSLTCLLNGCKRLIIHQYKSQQYEAPLLEC